MKLKKFIYRLMHWEDWEYRVKYIPLIPAWIWYCIRSGSLWFFTSSNPTITFGGMDGETKKEMYEQLPPGSYPRSIYINPEISFEAAEKLRVANDFHFPFVVKPDKGMMGFLFRIINNPAAFKSYHQKIPVEYIIQEYISYPVEVSVFYYRFPNEAKGTITGFLKKGFLEVVGDGKSTLWELILKYPRVQFRLEEMKAKHAQHLNDVIPAGEVFRLSHALNLSRGGRLISLAKEKDDRLLKVFDDLSHYSKAFFYGRYDIKCASIEDLKSGRNFSILEYNGSGAEPHHIYGDGNSLFKALKILLHHWNVLYRISSYNHRNGHPYWNFKRGWKFRFEAKKEFLLRKRLERELGN